MPYIDDGYTVTSLVPKVDDCPEFELEFRPMLHTERTRLAIGTDAAQRSGDNDRMEEWEQRTLKAISDKIKAWTLKDRNGKPVKPSLDALRRLHPGQFGVVYNVVARYSDPIAKDDGTDGESLQESDEKN